MTALATVHDVRVTTRSVHPHRMDPHEPAAPRRLRLVGPEAVERGRIEIHHDRPVRPAPSERYRLTRRGRLVVVVGSLVAAAVLAVALGAEAVATRDLGALPTNTIHVMPGETLWQIATDANPGGDIRATVDDIMRLNSLARGASLQTGAEIIVPDYS